MGKKMTTEQFRERMKIISPDITITGEYLGQEVKIEYICGCGKIASTIPSSLLRGVHCRECAIKKLSKLFVKTQEDFVKEMAIKRPKIIITGTYVNDSTKIKYICECGTEWESSPRSLLNGARCKKCSIKATSEAKLKSPDKYKEQLFLAHPEVELITKYVNQKTLVRFRCKCGNISEKMPLTLLENCKCPQCILEEKRKKFALTDEEFRARLNIVSPDVEPLEKYINGTTKMKYKCGCGRIDYMMPFGLLNGSHCSFCGSKKTGRILAKTDETFRDQLKIVNPKIITIDKYVNSITKIRYICECGTMDMATPQGLLHGQKCFKCSDKKVCIGTRYTFEDGERTTSQLEHMFSLYLRGMGFSYNKDYFRDILYNKITDTNLKSNINCDYKIIINENRTIYIELAGMLSFKTQQECYKSNTPIYDDERSEKYRLKLNKKHELLKKYNLEHYILFPSDMTLGTYDKIFNINVEKVI
jgi:hypothetical protein